MNKKNRPGFIKTCLAMSLLHAIFGNDRRMWWMWLPWGMGPW